MLVDAIVKLKGEVIDTIEGEPVAIVTLRNAARIGFVALGSFPSSPLIAMVNALVATVALI